MEISRPHTLPVVIQTRAGENSSLVLKPGQILQAVVTKIEAANILLNIAGSVIETRPIPPPAGNGPAHQFDPAKQLAPGAKISVQVTAQQGTPALKILTTPVAPEHIAVLPALRTAIPRQESLSNIFSNLVWLNQSQEGGRFPLVPAVRQRMREVIQHLPTPAQLRQPGEVRKAILNSGLFTENRLVNAASSETPLSNSDLRVALLRIATLIRNSPPDTKTPVKQTLQQPASMATAKSVNSLGQADNTSANKLPVGDQAAPVQKPVSTPSVQTPTPQARVAPSLAGLQGLTDGNQELLQQIETAVSRIQAQQLTSVAQTGETHRPNFMFELPVRTENGIDLFQFRIERDSQEQDNPDRPASWSISMAFDLQSLGPVRILVTLLQQQISVTFWAEQTETHYLFKQHATQLHDQLNNAGLNVGRIQCRPGKPEHTDFHSQNTMTLVDEKA